MADIELKVIDELEFKSSEIIKAHMLGELSKDGVSYVRYYALITQEQPRESLLKYVTLLFPSQGPNQSQINLHTPPLLKHTHLYRDEAVKEHDYIVGRELANLAKHLSSQSL